MSDYSLWQQLLEKVRLILVQEGAEDTHHNHMAEELALWYHKFCQTSSRSFKTLIITK